MTSIFDLPQGESEAIAFLQQKGILPEFRLCANGHNMKLSLGGRPQWWCRKKECKTTVRLRSGNWLENSRLPFLTALRFIFCWCEELTSIKWCAKHLGMSKSTAVDYNNYMREICAWSVIQSNSGKIGGDGKHVEVDESLFTKRKSNAGRVLPQQWLFGGVCRETNECFLVEVPDRTFETLMGKIKEHIAPGTTIFSDSWRAYITSELHREGFQHLKVNHRYNFVDPVTGAHTQKIERLWGSAKWRNKKHRGTARHHLESYLAEFMWRKKHAEDDLFDRALAAISAFWPPENHQ